MAEIEQSGGSASRYPKIRVTKRSTRIDMTPMVDLAFLLLTFFILTTAFKKDRALPLTMPDKPDKNSILPVMPASGILNLVLDKNDRIYWWIGLDPPVQATNYSREGVRTILLERRKAVPELMVLIKPDGECRYENIVDILDEMAIARVARYAVVDLTADDRNMISQRPSGSEIGGGRIN